MRFCSACSISVYTAGSVIISQSELMGLIQITVIPRSITARNIILTSSSEPE